MLMSSKEVITGIISRSAQKSVQHVSLNIVYVFPLERTATGSTGTEVNPEEGTMVILHLHIETIPGAPGEVLEKSHYCSRSVMVWKVGRSKGCAYDIRYCRWW